MLERSSRLTAIASRFIWRLFVPLVDSAYPDKASPEHKRALDEHGPCAIHRRLFAPVRTSLAAHGLPVPMTASVMQAAELAARA